MPESCYISSCLGLALSHELDTFLWDSIETPWRNWYLTHEDTNRIPMARPTPFLTGFFYAPPLSLSSPSIDRKMKWKWLSGNHPPGHFYPEFKTNPQLTPRNPNPTKTMRIYIPQNNKRSFMRIPVVD